jgi:hypothetical protein
MTGEFIKRGRDSRNVWAGKRSCEVREKVTICKPNTQTSAFEPPVQEQN